MGPGAPSRSTATSSTRAAAIAWWEDLTARGGEGIVVKCRGPEYLRIIYGPEYTTPEHLQRLKQRGLARKRSLALREFALRVEALERFVAGSRCGGCTSAWLECWLWRARG